MAGFTKRQREQWYQYLVNRDGECCYITRIPGDRHTLVIDHIDNNPEHNTPGNLMLVSKSINHIKNPRGKGFRTELHSSVGVSENGLDTPRASSLEFLKNMRAEPAFRTFLFREVVHCGRVRYSVALDEGASAADCSQETIKRYIRKEVTSKRPYVIVTDQETKECIIQFKPKWQVLHRKYVQRKKLESQARNWNKYSDRKVKKILESVEVKPADQLVGSDD